MSVEQHSIAARGTHNCERQREMRARDRSETSSAYVYLLATKANFKQREGCGFLESVMKGDHQGLTKYNLPQLGVQLLRAYFYKCV